MPRLDWNIHQWDGEYNWELKGEEWSSSWGSSEAQWFGSLYPRLHNYLPAARILEIAPGFGRWTRFLLNYCDDYTGIDLSDECVKACKKTFSHVEGARFFKNDGLSLEHATGQYDFVFSFDSLVHADSEVFDSYIPAILKLMRPDGVGFIHHSNFEDSGETVNIHNRSENVTAEYVRSLIQRNGGSALIQEKINWGSKLLIDCLTIFGPRSCNRKSVSIDNYDFMDEAENCKRVVNQYCSESTQR
jgi:2-polyprenyl-3-methyl-5-hydroxy-6-metoxy-1,4-benzoquinol methylase